MKAVVAMASVLACAFSLNAQITATINRRPNGMDQVRVRNNFGTPLVAFAITVTQGRRSLATSNAPFVVYSDSLIEPKSPPMLANEERVVMTKGAGERGVLSPGQHALEEPIATAGIFADGATTGDPVLLTRLISRRSSMLLAVETALEALADAGKRNIPRDQLIKQFRKMAYPLNRWYVPPEQRVGRGLYQSIAAKLMSLPEGELGSPFPPANFVEQETAALNRQRVTLLESKPSLADATLIESVQPLLIY